ncbi:MAG: 50S ribosomal protein L18Ae [Candidatus Thalassarchaeum sp.]
MKAFRATGTFRAGKRDQPYILDLVAEDDSEAKERIFSNFGSRHGTSRRFVRIDSLEIINPSTSTAPVVVAHFRDSAVSEEE